MYTHKCTHVLVFPNKQSGGQSNSLTEHPTLHPTLPPRLFFSSQIITIIERTTLIYVDTTSASVFLVPVRRPVSFVERHTTQEMDTLFPRGTGHTCCTLHIFHT